MEDVTTIANATTIVSATTTTIKEDRLQEAGPHLETTEETTTTWKGAWYKTLPADTSQDRLITVIQTATE